MQARHCVPLAGLCHGVSLTKYVTQQIYSKTFVRKRVKGTSELKHKGEIRADRQRHTDRGNWRHTAAKALLSSDQLCWSQEPLEGSPPDLVGR